MSPCKISLISGYSQTRLKKRLFSFSSASSHLSNKPQQSYLTPSYQQYYMAYTQQCDINNAQSRSLFSLRMMQHSQTLQSYFHLGVYIFQPRVLLRVGRGAKQRWIMCVLTWLRLLLCRSSSSGSLWTLMDRINRTHVAQAVCLLGFAKSKASISE